MQELNGADLNGRPLMVREDREDRDVKNYQIDHARETRNESVDTGKCQVTILRVPRGKAVCNGRTILMCDRLWSTAFLISSHGVN